MDHLAMFPSAEAAIENACRLMDDGYDVFGIGVGDLTELDRARSDRRHLRHVGESEISVRRGEGVKAAASGILPAHRNRAIIGPFLLP